jgi:type I restriction enzyme S subunit
MSLLEHLDLTKAIESKIDKSNWVKWKFSDLVENIVEKVVPKDSGLTHYIGLEHLDSGSLKIRRFGETNSLIGDKLRIYKGDFIFAKRNAYLKRVAIADFDAVASAHSLVLRPKLKNVLPEFLPFFMLSEAFWERAIEISVGSLSPTINWKVLAKQEFLLPPMHDQAKLAELLWDMDDVIEKKLKLINNLENSLDAFIEKEIHGINFSGKVIREVLEELSRKIKLVPLSELGTLLKGKGISKSDVIEEGIPCVRYGELYTRHNRVIRKFYSFISHEIKADSFLLKKNDILFAGSGETITEIGKSAAFVDEIEAYAGSDTLIFRPFDMDGYYLGYLMNSQLVRQQLNKYGTGATVMHIYNSDLEKVQVPKIEKNKQIEIGNKLEAISESINKLELNISDARSLQKSLINQIF